MNFGVWWCVLVAASVGAEKWQWPEQAASVRIDTKVRFIDQPGQDYDRDRDHAQVQADELPFHEAAHTDGFYNRPAGAGRYPVRVETHPHRFEPHSIYSPDYSGKAYNSDGTLDSIQYCKCESTPECNPREDSTRACGVGKYLCCYKRPNKVTPQNTEYFNEIDDERPSLLPGREKFAHMFPAPIPAGVEGPFAAGYAHEAALEGRRTVLVGPGGPTSNKGLLVGPGGPSGVIGPHGASGVAQLPKSTPDVLVGPEGPTGVIGPAPIGHNKGILAGPNGPRDVGSSETAQRGVLVGPGGPTGDIGPRGYGQRPYLVGPGGPTGIIGPRMMNGYFNEFFGRMRRPGVLVGPGGPTGVIGPGRQLLVGPGGPTGQIGPQNYFV